MRLKVLVSLGLAFGLASLSAHGAQEMQLSYWDNQAYTTDNVPTQEQSENLWIRIRSGLQLEQLQSPLIKTHVDWYAKRPDYVMRMLDRSRLYLFHIVEEVEKRGMPMEIALLPMVESAYNPQAYSPSHAAGIWQFIPSTGKNYGLHQNPWYDGRRDVTAATQAALDYLQKLFFDFGSWELALAAYNCGEGCVSRAIQKNASRGLPTDYLSLSLPSETRHYVPKLMAIRQLVLDPESFGVELNDIPNEPYFTQVSLNTGAMDLRSCARLAGMSEDEFLSLNPAFPRKLIKSGEDVSVLVPVSNAELFQTNLEKGEWDSWQPVTVKRGMTATQIAEQFGTSSERICEHNHLHLKNGRLVKDQVILAPINNAAVEEKIETASWQEAVDDAREAKAASAKYYVVHKGETLGTIARKLRISSANIKRWNGLRSSRIHAGQRLIVQPAQKGHTATATASYAKPTKATTRYTVRRGDTLYSIANRFNISVSDLKAWNRLNNSSVQAGRKLTIRRS